jgi:hypothetical protein
MIALYPQAESGANSNAARAGTRGGAELKPSGFGAARNRDVNVLSLFSHSPDARVNGAVPVMSSQQSEIRAQAMRARLSVLAEVCGELGVPLPLRKLLAPAMGATPRQIDRYMAALLDAGVVKHRTHKNCGRIVG